MFTSAVVRAVMSTIPIEQTIFCYGFGNNITMETDNRYNMLSPSCSKTVSIRKSMIECLDKLNIEIDSNLLDTRYGTADMLFLV